MSDMSDADTLPAILSETTLSTLAAAKLLRTTRKTVARWLVSGFKVNGVTTKLEGVMVGGRWTTSREAVSRFLERTTQARTPPAVDTPAELERAHQAALKRLAKLGVKVPTRQKATG